ncbi:MAG: YlbF family regulator [Peptococcaceae bacterium]|nr:YlbF family regulator [Peptococcaceae bacterium]
MSIFDQALELGREIARTGEYGSMQKAERAILADPEACKAVQEFQDLQQSYYRMRMQGQDLTEDHLNRLKEAEERAMAHALVREYYQARLQFHEIVDKVNAKIQEGMTGIRADACGGG